MTNHLVPLLYLVQYIFQKERDVELAARIGQTLLEKNKKLTAENEELEEHLVEAQEKVGVNLMSEFPDLEKVFTRFYMLMSYVKIEYNIFTIEINNIFICVSYFQVTQLKHEISMKNDIIKVYVQDYDGTSLPGTPG